MEQPTLSRREARKDDRRRLILAEAERSFSENGYGGTTMSAIAAALGGSKATLWSYYPSKERLFEALLDSKIEHFSAALDAALIDESDVAAALTRFGQVFLEKLLRPEFLAMRRLIATEGGRFPEIAAAMYERGPRRTRRRLGAYLADQMEKGALRAGDPLLAARHFISLCQSLSLDDRFWHRPDMADPDPARDARVAVETFLNGWGAASPKSAGPSSATA